jgi:hypothetical protein
MTTKHLPLHRLGILFGIAALTAIVLASPSIVLGNSQTGPDSLQLAKVAGAVAALEMPATSAWPQCI